MTDTIHLTMRDLEKIAETYADRSAAGDMVSKSSALNAISKVILGKGDWGRMRQLEASAADIKSMRFSAKDAPSTADDTVTEKTSPTLLEIGIEAFFGGILSKGACPAVALTDCADVSKTAQLLKTLALSKGCQVKIRSLLEEGTFEKQSLGCALAKDCKPLSEENSLTIYTDIEEVASQGRAALCQAVVEQNKHPNTGSVYFLFKKREETINISDYLGSFGNNRCLKLSEESDLLRIAKNEKPAQNLKKPKNTIIGNIRIVADPLNTIGIDNRVPFTAITNINRNRDRLDFEALEAQTGIKIHCLNLSFISQDGFTELAYGPHNVEKLVFIRGIENCPPRMAPDVEEYLITRLRYWRASWDMHNRQRDSNSPVELPLQRHTFFGFWEQSKFEASIRTNFPSLREELESF